MFVSERSLDDLDVTSRHKPPLRMRPQAMSVGVVAETNGQTQSKPYIDVDHYKVIQNYLYIVDIRVQHRNLET